MLDREKVGMRIRQVRTEQQKTLREVESASGFSSTHISEIERGRTSPTIGALIQIAHALEKDPSFFIEERELDEVAVTNPGRRATVDPELMNVEGTGILLEGLTPGILGGRIEVIEMILEPGAHGRIIYLPPQVDVCIVCLEGGMEVDHPERPITFGPDDSSHVVLEPGLTFRNNTPNIGRILFILDPATTHL